MTPQELFRASWRAVFPRAKMQTRSPQSGFTYTDGPMLWLGQQIVKTMQESGFPAKIHENYRSPERQSKLKGQGFSKAGAWESPHQFFEAVDIIHPGLGWDVPEEYWEALATAVRVVSAKHGVDLVHGHYWKFRDSAHVELKDWRKFREVLRARWRLESAAYNERIHKLHPEEWGPAPEPDRPTSEELAERFRQVLPDVWKAKHPAPNLEIWNRIAERFGWSPRCS